MTRRDYLSIGHVLHQALEGRPNDIRLAILKMAEDVANVFEADNPQFQRERFMWYVEQGTDNLRPTPGETS